MKGIEMYAKIQELKELGMSQNAVAAQLEKEPFDLQMICPVKD